MKQMVHSEHMGQNIGDKLAGAHLELLLSCEMEKKGHLLRIARWILSRGVQRSHTVVSRIGIY